MNLVHTLILIFLVASTGIVSTSPFVLAQYNKTINMQTDLASYKYGDYIIVKGSVSSSVNTAVSILILDPNQKIILNDKLFLAPDGSFYKAYIAAGPSWVQSGTYTIQATYSDVTTFTAFSFSGGTGQPFRSSIVSDTFQLHIGPLPFYVPYIIKGGTVKNMSALADKLEIIINAQTAGSITVTLPRQVIDSKVPANLTQYEIGIGAKMRPENLEDNKFFVLSAGQVVQYTETKTLTTRTLGIPIYSGNTTVDLIGTKIGPAPQSTVTSFVFIPSWIKHVANFWCDGQIDDSSFAHTIQYLVTKGVIIIQGQTAINSTQVTVKHVACLWSNDQTSDQDFASTIQYLHK